MTGFDFTFAGVHLTALGSGALWWPDERLLVVSDLHLGRSERAARRNGTLLPPYEVDQTLDRLGGDLRRLPVATVVCLGDSFDDRDAGDALSPDHRARLAALQAGRRWVWIEGNHDPGPIDIAGEHRAELQVGPLALRHIATPGASGEVSGHYHPKAPIRTRGGTVTRACFLVDRRRVILPAYGAYVGGLRTDDHALSALMEPDALAIVIGPRPMAFAMPRHANA